MKALALAAALLAVPASAETAPPPDAAEGAAPAKDAGSRWTGGVTFMWGEGGPHAAEAACCLPTSIDGYGEFGRKVGDSLAVLVVALGEWGVVEGETTHLLSGGLGLRLIGDRLGGLAAPIELTLGAGVGRVMQGTTPLNDLTYGLIFLDTVFPITRYLRLHSQLIEHVDYVTGSAFLSAGIGLGLTFE